MIELEKFSCNDSTEARIKEQEYYENLNPSLNSCPPYVNKSNYYCNICNIQLDTFELYNKHLQTNKHNRQANNKKNINVNLFNCQICNFSCKKKSDQERHTVTKKHLYNINKIDLNTNPTTKETKTYRCICGKNYKSRQGISHHKKVCSTLLTKEEPEVCKCAGCVSNNDALENKIKELESKIDNQYEIIVKIYQILLL